MYWNVIYRGKKSNNNYNNNNNNNMNNANITKINQTTTLIRRREAYIQLEHLLANAYASNESIELYLSRFIDQIIIDISAINNECIKILSSPCLSSIAEMECDIMKYAYRVYIWFLSKTEISDLMFASKQSIEQTSFQTMMETILKILNISINYNNNNNNNNIENNNNNNHILTCYGCMVLKMGIMKHPNGMKLYLKNVNDIIETILKASLPISIIQNEVVMISSTQSSKSLIKNDKEVMINNNNNNYNKSNNNNESTSVQEEQVQDNKHNAALAKLNEVLDLLITMITAFPNINETQDDTDIVVTTSQLLFPYILHPNENIHWKMIEFLGKVNVVLLEASATTTETSSNDSVNHSIQQTIADIICKELKEKKLMEQMLQFYHDSLLMTTATSTTNTNNNNINKKIYIIELWGEIIQLIAPNINNSRMILNELLTISKDAFIHPSDGVRIAMFQNWKRLFNTIIRISRNQQSSLNNATKKKMLQLVAKPLIRRYIKEKEHFVVRKQILEVWKYCILEMSKLRILNEYVDIFIIPFCDCCMKHEENMELLQQMFLSIRFILNKNHHTVTATSSRTTDDSMNNNKKRKHDDDDGNVIRNDNSNNENDKSSSNNMDKLKLSLSNHTRILKYIQTDVSKKNMKINSLLLSMLEEDATTSNDASTFNNNNKKKKQKRMDVRHEEEERTGNKEEILTYQTTINALQQENKILKDIIANLRGNGHVVTC